MSSSQPVAAETPAGADMTGLLPLGVDPERESIRLISAGGARLSEPFYHESLESVKESRRPTLDLSFGELRAQIGDRSPSPLAVILHTGRCGSTLLLRMLQHDRTLVTVSEPLPISTPHWDALHSPLRAERDRQAMADLLVVFDRFASARGQRVVVKLSSWETIDAAWLVDQLFPAAPVVFVHRPVEQVVSSLLDQRPAWGDGLDMSVVAGWSPRLAKLSAGAEMDEVYAAFWASEVSAALALDAVRVLAISYSDLIDRTPGVLAAVAAHVGLGSSWKQAAAAAELRYYAKARNPTVAFEPSGRHSRPALTADAAERVRAVVGDLPDQLDERSRRG